jgi:hypothetical protein
VAASSQNRNVRTLQVGLASDVDQRCSIATPFMRGIEGLAAREELGHLHRRDRDSTMQRTVFVVLASFDPGGTGTCPNFSLVERKRIQEVISLTS